MQAMRGVAKTLEQQQLTSFTPHYLMWACQAEYLNTDDCRTKCIFNG